MLKAIFRISKSDPHSYIYGYKRKFRMKTCFALLMILLVSKISFAQVTSFDIDSSKLIIPLLAPLDSLGREDQAPRLKVLDAIRNKASTKQIDSLKVIMHEKDKQNLVMVEAVLSKYGWLGPQKVGFNGSEALFLVIQHADLLTQQKYLPMIRTAEKNGETLSSNLAILEDRIAMREGRKQIYGSQGFTDKVTGKKYIFPMIDPDKLDERRKAMGMPPMAVYEQSWDLTAYKKELPEIERIVKQQNIK